MIEELGAKFSARSKTEIFQEEDARLEIIQGELLPQFAGADYEDILKYLKEKHRGRNLPPKI